MAVVVDDADVHIGIGLGMHDLEHLVEIGLVGEFLEGVGVGDGEQLGNAFVEEQIDGVAPVFRGAPQGLRDFFGVDAVEKRVEGNIDKDQGDNGKANDGQAVLPPELSIISFHCHILTSAQSDRHRSPIGRG